MKKSRVFLCLILIVTFLVSSFNVTLIVNASNNKYELGGVELYTDNKAVYDNIKDELPNFGSNKVPPEINVKGAKLPLNYRLWKQKGIVVYGSYRSVPGNRFKCGYQDGIDPNTGFPKEFSGGYYEVNLSSVSCSEHGKACPSKIGNTVRGEWQYFGYDINGNLSTNMWFRNDQNVTKFNQRDWIKEPWREELRKETKLSGISIFNESAYEQFNGRPVREWIGRTLDEWGGVPSTNGLDPEVYKYLYVQSAPTIMHSGSGRMWHRRPSQLWYQTLSIPRLATKQHPNVTVDTLDVTGDFNPSTRIASISIPNTSLADDQIIYIDVKLKGSLKDEEYYNDPVKESIWFTRKDVKYWNFYVKIFGKEYVESHVPVSSKESNTQIYEFIKRIPVKYADLRALLDEGAVATVKARPIYDNDTYGNEGVNYFAIGPAVIPQYEAAVPFEGVDLHVPNLEIRNSIPEIAFDGIPFEGPRDDTDMSLVSYRKVYVGGKEVDDNLFFSGNYIFPRTTDRNGYLTTVEVIYKFNTDAIDVGSLDPSLKDEIVKAITLEYKSTDIVYVYPTKPYASFKLSSNSWKENRIINLENTSESSNIQLVIERFPIVKYRWYYGGDTEHMHFGTNTDLQKQLQFSKPGVYSITLEAMNSLGEWSEPYTCEFTVLEDYGPNIECNLTDSVITRQDTIGAWHYDVVSTDDDRISKVKIELWYDSNADGEVDIKLAEWNGLGDNGICEKDDFPSYTAEKLGYYLFKIYAEEEFIGVPGQDTLQQFIPEGYKRTAYYEVEWWCDNYQPLSDIYIDAPIERPKIDVFIMLDKDLNDSKRQSVMNNRVNYENFLLGYNLIPNIKIWDMKTYTYSQPASTNYTTGTSYPPATIQYESNGYSGTLTRQQVVDNGSYQDLGSYKYRTETKTFTASHTNNCTTVYKRSSTSDSWTQVSNYESSPAPSSKYINSDGYSGSIPRTNTVTNYRNESVSADGLTKTVTASYTAYYEGTLSKQVQYWEPNVQWVSKYVGIYTGTIYKDVRQPYTDPYMGAETSKFIMYYSDTVMNEKADFDMAKSKADAKILLAGSFDIKGQSSYDLYIDVTGKTADQVMDAALEFIAQSCPTIEQYYVLPGQQFILNLAEFDLEGDEIIERQLQYVHEKNYFDNPTGQEPDTLEKYDENTGWTNDIKDRFFNVGRYRIFRRVKDLPDGENGTNYSYYSGATEVNIYVHRKPIADAVLDWKYNPDTGLCETVWVDKSYDLDHTSLPNKGIVERKIMFRKNGGEWLYYIPDVLSYGNYEVMYYVKDMEGVWSDPWTFNFTLDGNPQFTASARPLSEVFTLSSIPASEYIEFYNLWTRQPNDIRLEFSLTPTVAGQPATKVVTYQPGVTGTKSGQDISWVNQTMQIPEIFPDGPRTLIALARDLTTGTVTSIPFNINVYTPINLIPGIDGKTLNNNIQTTVTATTTKYPSTTTVQLQYGTPYQTSALSMTGTVSGNTKTWSVNYTVPNNVPDGIYTARFVSTNPSGKQEIKTCTYTVVHNRPPVVNIIGTNPSPVYEGDLVYLKFIASDPDLDTLSCDIVIKKGSTIVWTGSKIVSPSGGVYEQVNVPTITEIPLGSYTAEVTVKDPYNLAATQSYNFAVNMMGIIGDIKPNPAMAGERITIIAETEGYTERVLVTMWNGDVVELTPTNSINNLYNTWTGTYIVPLHTPDATYPVNFTAIRGCISRTHERSLVVQGNLLNLVKPRIKKSN